MYVYVCIYMCVSKCVEAMHEITEPEVQASTLFTGEA